MFRRVRESSVALSCLLLVGGFAAAQNGSSPAVDRLVEAVLNLAPLQNDQLKPLLLDVANMNERAAQLNVEIYGIDWADSPESRLILERSIEIISELNSYAFSCAVRLGSDIPSFEGIISAEAENILETTGYGRSNAYKFLTETCAEVNSIAQSLLNQTPRDNDEAEPTTTISELQKIISRSSQAAIVQAGVSLQLALR